MCYYRRPASESIKGCPCPEDINGRENNPKSGIFPGGSLTGRYQESILTNQKHSKQSADLSHRRIQRSSAYFVVNAVDSLLFFIATNSNFFRLFRHLLHRLFRQLLHQLFRQSMYRSVHRLLFH